jgi:hypothetical protein
LQRKKKLDKFFIEQFKTNANAAHFKKNQSLKKLNALSHKYILWMKRFQNYLEMYPIIPGNNDRVKTLMS